MQPISATVITFNEERNIADALRSLSWADEIIVVDSGSSDATLDICRGFTDRILRRDWTGYVDQKNFAVENARHDWIFSLDADERATPELAAEIGRWAQTGFHRRGYRIPRTAFFMGRWIRHGDWHPDYQLRLFDRRHGGWKGGEVHESVRLTEDPGVLEGEIQHYTYRNLSDYLRRLETYSSLAAFDYRRRGRTTNPFLLLLHPTAAFMRAYLIKRGFLDGAPGLAVAVMGSVSVFFKYAKLYELQRQSMPVEHSNQ